MKILSITSLKRFLSNRQVVKGGAMLTTLSRCKSLRSDGLCSCMHHAQNDKLNSWTPLFTSHRGIHSSHPRQCDIQFFRLNKDKELRGGLPNMRTLQELMELDGNFELSDFLLNAVEAFRFVREELANGNLEDLSEVLTPECMSELKESLSRSTQNERELLGYSGSSLFETMPFLFEATMHNGSSGEKTVKLMMGLTALIFPLRMKGYNFGMVRTYNKDEKSLWRICYINMEYKKYF